MPAQGPLLPTLQAQIQSLIRAHGLPKPVATRLSLLTAGILEAGSCVLRQVAAALAGMKVTRATNPADIERRVRAILNDARITLAATYQPMLATAIDWEALRRAGKPVIVIIDESSHTDEVHLLRASLAYWGGAVVLAMRVWVQNEKLPDGQYGRELAILRQELAVLLPADLQIVIVADRAYDHPTFLDPLLTAQWDFVVRLKAKSTIRVRADGVEWTIADFCAAKAPAPGASWSGEVELFKKAGWRTWWVSIRWEDGQAEPLVVVATSAAAAESIDHYDRRFWIEPSFKNDKSHGFQWESCRVQGVERHQRLLVALAWASFLSVVIGRQQAETELARLAAPVPPGRPSPSPTAKPAHPRDSLFTLGLRAMRQYLWDATAVLPPLRLDRVDAPAWTTVWQAQRAKRAAA